MNYELAKELKDAGFPQNFNDRKALVNAEKSEYCAEPTLSELIEACGPQIVILVGKKQTSARISPNIGKTKAKGSTPEEAVARLWLALRANKAIEHADALIGRAVQKLD